MLSRLTQKVVVLRSHTHIPTCKKGISGEREQCVWHTNYIGLPLGDRNNLCFPVAALLLYSTDESSSPDISPPISGGRRDFSPLLFRDIRRGRKTGTALRKEILFFLCFLGGVRRKTPRKVTDSDVWY